MSANGRILAIDLGEKRIGLAVSDPHRMVAKSFGVIKRKSRREDFERYATVIAEQSVSLVVMGLPLMLDGSDSDQTRWVRHYSAELQKNIPVPLTLHDETYSSKQAEESMRTRNMTRKKRKASVDAVAAAFILQSYLDTHS